MLDQTKALLNELITVNQLIKAHPSRSSLLSIKIVLLETVMTALTYDINHDKIRDIRGLEKLLVQNQLSYLYDIETNQLETFNFYDCDLTIGFKYLLATLTERFILLDRRKEIRLGFDALTA